MDITQEQLDWINDMVNKTIAIGAEARIDTDDLCQMFLTASYAYYHPDEVGTRVMITPDNLLSLMCEVLYFRRGGNHVVQAN